VPGNGSTCTERSPSTIVRVRRHSSGSVVALSVCRELDPQRPRAPWESSTDPQWQIRELTDGEHQINRPDDAPEERS
jgi:hypothetical protein